MLKKCSSHIKKKREAREALGKQKWFSYDIAEKKNILQPLFCLYFMYFPFQRVRLNINISLHKTEIMALKDTSHPLRHQDENTDHHLRKGRPTDTGTTAKAG